LEKPTCLCGEEMVFLMDNKKHVIWECQSCYRLLLQRKYSGYQSWYLPEASSKERG